MMRRLVLVALLAASTAHAEPAGTVSSANLDFGSVTVGDSLDLSVTVTSTGDAALSGAIIEGCDDFSIVSGGGAYSLDPGQARAVTVRFKPVANGTHGCILTTSSCRCSNVTLSGEGVGGEEPVAICDVSPTSLDFGTLVPDSVVTKTFRIKNTGGAVLTGSVSEACANYSIIAGGGAYALAEAESVIVSVRFTAPAVDGDYPCTIETGGAVLKALAACSDVSATTTVRTPQPLCSILPASLAFGTLGVGEADTLAAVIKNVGDAGSILSGSVSEGCADYAILAGGSDFNLARGESTTVSVRFSSASTGLNNCTIDTGIGGCADIAASAFVTSGTDMDSTSFAYLGAFKFGSTGTALGYGSGKGLGHLSNGNLVILGTDLTGYIAVCTPATPVVTSDVGAMNQATTVSAFPDPTNGLWVTEGGNSRWEDITVLDDRIVFTSYSFYDRAYDGRGGMGFLSLAFTNPTGMFWPGPPDSVADAVSGGHKGIWYPGKTCGQGVKIPAAYVEGGRTLALGRSRDEFGEDTSAGPALYFMDPDDITNCVVALCYDQIGQSAENVPGPHSRTGYSLTDQVTDVAWIGDTVLFTETKCRYPSHYYQEGQGGELGDPGVCGENTGYTCGHAGDSEPGYVAQFTLYHASDLMAVSRGEVDNWVPEPYLTIDMTPLMVDADCSNGIAGATYNDANGRLYVMQTRRNGDGPICHVWQVTP